MGFFRPPGGVAVLVLAAGFWAAPVLAQADRVESARVLIADGLRTEARGVLDSLLSAADQLDPETRLEAGYLRALIEEDGPSYEGRLRVLLDMDPEGERAGGLHLALGRVAFARGDLQLAQRSFQAAIDAGRAEEGSLWEGLTAFALGDGSAARDLLKRAANSGNSAVRQRALLALGDTYRRGENWDQAASAYEKITDEKRLGPGWWPTAILRRAECMEKMGNTDQARRLYQELLNRTPESYEAPRARNRLAVLAGVPRPDASVGSEPVSEEGYAVQVGAFGRAENARGLAVRVTAGGFERVRVAEGKDGLHRVLVGRFDQRGPAESLGDSLGTALGLSFRVVASGRK